MQMTAPQTSTVSSATPHAAPQDHALSASPSSLSHYQIIRRNGAVVPFEPAKIAVAMMKAFLAVHGTQGAASASVRETVDAVTQNVVRALMRSRPGGGTFHIEDVQDQVELGLMRGSHHEVARAYVLYRERRAQERATQKEQQAPAVPTLHVTDRGERVALDLNRLTGLIQAACANLGADIKADPIVSETLRNLYDGVPIEEVFKAAILAARTLIEKDPDYTYATARLLMHTIAKEVLGVEATQEEMAQHYVDYFPGFIKKGVDNDLLDERLLQFDLKRLAGALKAERDLQFDYLGLQTLYDRYFLHVRKQRIELPQAFFMRVAMGLSLNEIDREARAIEFYEVLSSFDFMSSTPTLFNSGTLRSQLSSCYLTTVPDDLDGIYESIKENALLSKFAGGLGNDWTRVRALGSHIKGTNGESQGVVPFLKVVNDTAVAVNQGGKRKGAVCTYLETWHLDIEEFLELRKNTGDDRRRTHDMNTANWIPDLFMKRMEDRKHWTLFRSNEVKDLHDLYGSAFERRYLEYERLAEEGKISGQRIEALELWKKMLSMLFETGHPWITFKDACNIRSPQDHAGVIHSSNLCTEITLNTSNEETAVCNLGSVILETHLKPDGSLDHAKLRETIRIAVRALDNVIDINFYPTVAARTSNLRHRPIGLGVMGLAHAIYLRGHAFASNEAVEFNDEAMEAVAFYAYEASSDLAAERGTYSSYKGSKWDRGLLPQDTLDLLEKERGVTVEVPRGGRLDWTPIRAKIAAQGMRNSNCLAIAPTATISNITATSPCIEPTYKNLFVKSNLSGEFIVLNPFLVKDLKSRGLWDQDMIDDLKYFDGELKDIERIPADLKAKYLTAFDIDFKWILDAAARRQKWIDQAQSVNLWIKTPDLKTLSHMYRHAWRSGLKTTYYLRSLGASNIEKATVAAKKEVRGAVAAGLEADKAKVAEVAAPVAPAPKRQYTEAEKKACSIEAMRRGEECEACQ